jgi:hypothetical protein
MPGEDDLPISSVRGATPTDAAAPTAASTAVDAAGADSVDSVDSITAELAAGRIDAIEARSRLIECAVSEQLPAGASPELADAVRAEVEAILADDPTLDAMLGG